MNFLNPIVLAGLVAAGVPLLLHLLARRRAREVPFPSIRLLIQLQTDRIRMLRLKQLLLLILRTLIVLLVVIGFARPALRSAFHAGTRTAAVIVIDTSASMTAIDTGESFFDRAKRAASDIIGLMRAGDTAAVVTTAEAVGYDGTGLTGDLRGLAERIAGREPSHATGDPTAAFDTAISLLSSSHTVNREIYYLTDGAVNALPDSITGEDADGIRLYVVSIGPGQRSGAVMEDLRLVDKVVVPGSPLTFVAEGSTGMDSAVAEVSFFVNGERKRKVAVTPDANGRFSAECTYIPESVGWIEVAASTGDGGFVDGETRRLEVRVHEPVPVLIVAGGYADGYFLERMLSTARADSVFAVTVAGETDVIPTAVSGASVIVLAGVRELAEETYRAIVTGVMRGGKGLVVIPADTQPAALYGEGLFRDLFPLGAYGTVSFENRDGLRYTVMDRYDFTHPVMRGISQGGSFAYPRVTSYLAVEPPPGARVFARYDDGGMAAADTDCGNGRVILFTGDAASLTGELAFTGIFIPMFLRSVQYLSDTLPEAGVTVTGEPLAVSFPVEEGVAQVTVRHDDRAAVRAAFRQNGLHAVLDSFVPDTPGFYAVAADGVERLGVGVNIPRGEAVSTRAGDAAISGAFGNVSWRTLDETENIADVVTRDRFGTELAGLFLGAALVLLALEMVLARKA